uniref:Uncharacterized protein n=1 Tax=Rhizophora mucronata TaxID=61149 RepID=A0A2P2MZQ6_RHIMU
MHVIMPPLHIPIIFEYNLEWFTLPWMFSKVFL